LEFFWTGGSYHQNIRVFMSSPAEMFMTQNTLLYGSQHCEVDWSDRYTPPKPGMILLEQRCAADSKRMMFVWGWRTPQSSAANEIVCWSEPNEPRACDKVGYGAVLSRQGIAARRKQVTSISN
jgi:hypothetical protein